MKREEVVAIKLEEIEKKSLQVIAEIDCKGVWCNNCPLSVKIHSHIVSVNVCIKLLCRDVLKGA